MPGESPLTCLPLQRDKHIDLFRGLALLTIYIDHIHPNLLASFTLGRFAFLDAADIFVFISGYVIGLVYTRELWRGGFRACVNKAWRRCSQIYCWHLAGAGITFFVLYCFSRHGLYLEDRSLYTFLQAPLRTAVSLIILTHAPSYFGILPLYLILTAITPAAVYFIDKSKWWFLACSAALYLAVQSIPRLTLQSGASQLMMTTFSFFNPLAWQFLFIAGVLMGNWRLHGRKWPALFSRWSALAGILVFLIACVLTFATSSRLAVLLHTNFWRLHLANLFLYNDKSTLGPLRLLNLLIFLFLIRRWTGTAAFWDNTVVRAIARCGRNSLEVFSAGVLLSYLATLLVLQHPASIQLQVYVSTVGCMGLIAVADLVSGLKDQKSAIHAGPFLLRTSRHRTAFSSMRQQP
jgi:hypothetical protein